MSLLLLLLLHLENEATPWLSLVNSRVIAPRWSIRVQIAVIWNGNLLQITAKRMSDLPAELTTPSAIAGTLINSFFFKKKCLTREMAQIKSQS
jgi:hypothetical protein